MRAGRHDRKRRCHAAGLRYRADVSGPDEKCGRFAVVGASMVE
jgi:hypothetical protein